MSGMFQVPAHTSGELRFRVFDVPVRVHPWFWIVSALMGLNNDTKTVMVWVAVVFVSILVHELGHVAAFRTFGARAEAILYSFGGLAVPTSGFHRTTGKSIVISAAGPFAGFLLAGLIAAGGMAMGADIYFDTAYYVLPDVRLFVGAPNYSDFYYTNIALNYLMFLNIYWGLVNLLPVFPLDGGHISLAIFADRDRVNGRRNAALLSAFAGALLAVTALSYGETYIFFLFGFLAVGSIQEFDKLRRRTI